MEVESERKLGGNNWKSFEEDVSRENFTITGGPAFLRSQLQNN